MKKILLLFVMAYVSSCTQDLTQNENMQPQSDETTAPVKSESYILTLLMIYPPRFLRWKRDRLSTSNIFQRPALQLKRWTESSFRSASTCSIKVFEFTDVELAEIAADSLEYGPEDSLIVDPYMTAILNGEREVQVGDKICRFVEDGMMMYDANEKVLFDPNLVEQKLAVESMSHGQVVEIADTKGVKAPIC